MTLAVTSAAAYARRTAAAEAGKPGAAASVWRVTRYRFLDSMGDVMDEREFPDHAAALAWAHEEEELDDEVLRVEFLGPEGDWRWAGPLQGRGC
jgi:hypothetical protein